jgi:hypothetical protein
LDEEPAETGKRMTPRRRRQDCSIQAVASVENLFLAAGRARCGKSTRPDVEAWWMTRERDGTHIYAAVYRSGHSILDASLITKIRDQNEDQARDFFDKHCPVKEQDPIQAMSKMDSSNEHLQYIILRRRDTPGLGKTMERLSISACKEIANRLNFGFYAGDQGYGISVWY